MTATLSDGRVVPVIDVDTHVVEPYDLWTSRISTARWGDKVPHVVWDDDAAEDVWVAGATKLGPAAGPAMAGYVQPPPNHPPTLSDASPATWDVTARLASMDEYGVDAQVLYPNVAGFGGGKFAEVADRELTALMIRAYNDFLTDFASAAPDRLIPVAGLPFWDIDLSIAEMTRVREAGHRGVIFSQQPEYFGQPRLSDPHWDPLWAAAQEMGMPINFHIGSGDMSGMSLLHQTAGAAANYASFPVTFFVGNCRTIATLIGGGVCHRFPDLQFVSVESGVGWVPFALQALDWMWRECAVTKEHPEYDLLPSEYFKRQIYACFWFEHGDSLASAIATLGADRILYETDFPHPTSMTPGPASTAVSARQFIEENLSGIDADDLERILHTNARELYRLGS